MTPIEYVVVYHISELPQFDPDIPVFCDIETDGLYINTRLIQYYQPETSPLVWILDVDYYGVNKIPMLRRLGKNIEDHIVTSEQVEELHSKLHLVFWNGSYDQGTLGFGSAEVDDLFYMAKTALPKLGKFNLNLVTDYLFPNDNFYHGLDKKALQKAGFKQGTLTEDQLRYSATDVYVMKLIWDKIQPIVGDKLAYKINKRNLGYTARWQQTGLAVNKLEHTKEVANQEQILADVSKLLPEGLNVNSYIQVRKCVNHDQSDEEALLRLSSKGCPYSLNILKKRSTLKTLNFLKTYNVDKVYGFYNPMGTRTGRWSCKGGDAGVGFANLQQLPRKLKHIFGFEEDNDKIFVGADLPTAELRLATAIYVDDTMYQAFKNLEDIHRKTASKTSGIPQDQITDEQRKKAKAENFGLLYGMKADKFRRYAFTNYGLVLTEEEAEERRNNWMKTYQGIKNTIDRVTKQFYREELIVYTPMGLPVQPDLYTDALNIPIQGAVSELSKLWIHYMFEMHGGLVPIANMVHDSISIETTIDKAEYWKDLMNRAWIKTWEEYNKLPMMILKDIPMDIEIGVSKNYKDVS